MYQKNVVKQYSLFFVANVLSLSLFSISAQEDTARTELIEQSDIDSGFNQDQVAGELMPEMNELEARQDVQRGMNLFQGKERFELGGPSCITCHNVVNDKLIPGGLFAKDLTDVYDRLGEGLVGWLGAPPFPAMADSYNNNPLTEEERLSLTSFLKHANEVKGEQTGSTGYALFITGGLLGLLCLLGIIQLIWVKRKRKMVKEDIFNRQARAWDGKF
jgi:hypothetical protein